MSSALNPFGLMPALHQSGTIRPSAYPGTIDSGYGSNIFLGSAVAQVADGSLNIVGVTGSIIGAFQGVEYTPTGGGRRVVSNWWPSGTTYTATPTQPMFAWYTSDPWMTYLMQGDGSIAQSNLGNVGPITAEAGNTTTGFSTQALHAASLANTGNNQIQVVGLWQDINNAWGDAFTVVEVQIAEHQYVANRTGS